MTSRALLRSQRVALIAIVGLSLLATIVEAGFLVIVARVGVALTDGADAITVRGDSEIAMTTGLTLAAVFVAIRLLTTVAGAAVSSRSIANAAVKVRSEFTDAYLSTAWEVKHGLAPGRVQQLLSSYTQTSVNVVSAVARGLTAVVSLAALIAVAFVIQPYITLSAVSLLAVLGLAMVPLRRKVQRSSERAAAAQLTFGTRVNETESLALEIEVHGVGEAVGDRVKAAAIDAAVSNGKSQFARLAIGPAYQAIAYGGVLALLAVGVNTGVDDIGTIGAVLLLLLRCLGYGQSLQVARAQYTQSDVYAKALEEEVARYRASLPTKGVETSSGRSGVAASRLDFSYHDADPTLRDLSFSFDSGTIVGVVGPSGSGKTTLTQLLLGLRSSGGALSLDGVAIDDADPRWWSTQVALVPQHSQLLTGSVADNVRFLRTGVSDSDIETACRRAAIHDEIVAMGGYSASVGERGGALSGGQRQRLCIARALAGRPNLLVLDEPTSALDTTSERRVLDTLAGLRGETTVIIVTHRLAVLDVCDEVLALDAGQIDYLGPASEFRATVPDTMGEPR